MNKQPLIKVGGQRMGKNQSLVNATNALVNPARVHPSSFIPVSQLTSDKTNRNGPCPCGSGKKYKKCCIGKEIDVDQLNLTLKADDLCPCGSGWTVKDCGCPRTVPKGIKPRLLDKSNPADIVGDPKDEWPLEDYITAVVHANDGKPFPPEYNQVIEAYHRHGWSPDFACQHIQMEMQGKEIPARLTTKLLESGMTALEEILKNKELDRIRALAAEGMAAVTGDTDGSDQSKDG